MPRPCLRARILSKRAGLRTERRNRDERKSGNSRFASTARCRGSAPCTSSRSAIDDSAECASEHIPRAHDHRDPEEPADPVSTHPAPTWAPPRGWTMPSMCLTNRGGAGNVRQDGELSACRDIANSNRERQCASLKATVEATPAIKRTLLSQEVDKAPNHRAIACMAWLDGTGRTGFRSGARWSWEQTAGASSRSRTHG